MSSEKFELPKNYKSPLATRRKYRLSPEELQKVKELTRKPPTINTDIESPTDPFIMTPRN